MSTHGGGGTRKTAQGVAERARSPRSVGYTIKRGAGVDDALRAVLGRTLTDAEAGRLFAAEPGATLRISAMSGGNISYNSSKPGASYQWGYLGPDMQGRRSMYIFQAEVDASRRGQGVGTTLFARQAKLAAALHIPVIGLEAARTNRTNLSGIQFWPHVGFNAELPETLRDSLPARLRGARTVQDLMRSPTGRQWWARNPPDGMMMEFDTTPGSRSMQVLKARLAANGTKWADV